MIPHWKRYAIFGVVLYLLFIITQVPAKLVYGWVADTLKASPAKIQLYRVSGSIWSGKAAYASVSGNTLRNLRWDLHLSSLLLGRAGAGISFKLNDSPVEADVYQSLGGDLILKDVVVRTPMSEVMRMAKLPAIKLEGLLEIKLDSLVVTENMPSEAEGVIVWKGAETRFPQTLKLGDLKATLETTDAGIEAVLSDGGGPLEAGGKLTLSQDGAYNFDGSFSSREGRNSPLGRSLSMMGRQDAQGKVQIKNAGNLKALGFLVK